MSADATPSARASAGSTHAGGTAPDRSAADSPDGAEQPAAQYALALRTITGPAGSGDFVRAAKLFEQAANGGIADAAYNLGVIYERGLGQPADPVQALRWYRRAAEQNHHQAQYNLAVLYAGHSDAGHDYAQAAYWFERAAAAGLTNAQYNLALLMERGLGVAPDPQHAYQWLGIAARSGDAQAQAERDRLRAALSSAQLAAAERAIAAFTPDPQPE